MSNVAGSLIRDARQRSRMSQRDLARLAGTSQAAVQAYESGRRRPSVERLLDILDAAGFELRMRLTRGGTPTPAAVPNGRNRGSRASGDLWAAAAGPEEDDRLLERMAMTPKQRLQAMLVARQFSVKYRGAALRPPAN